MKIAVTGWKGRLGSQLVDNDCYILDVDITDKADVYSKIKLLAPDVVINCAAITDVDGCESEDGYTKALDVNYLAVENVRCACKEYDSNLIQISTDYIFGSNNGAYSEKNRPLAQSNGEPVNNYGWSKLGGEDVLLTTNIYNNLIVRTTGLYGNPDKHDFLQLIQETVGEGKELKVTKELIGNQTYIPHLAKALIYVTNNIEIIRNNKVLNIASEDIISRYEFALAIADIFGYNKELIIPCLNSEIVEWKAKRPKKAGLKTSLAKKLGVPIYTIAEGLKECRKII